MVPLSYRITADACRAPDDAIELAVNGTPVACDHNAWRPHGLLYTLYASRRMRGLPFGHEREDDADAAEGGAQEPPDLLRVGRNELTITVRKRREDAGPLLITDRDDDEFGTTRTSNRAVGFKLLQELLISYRVFRPALMPVGEVLQILRHEDAQSLVYQVGHGLPRLGRLQPEGSVQVVVQVYGRLAHADSMAP